MKVGLRIDVDTFRGTRDGVPGLCRVLAKHGVRGTFFFSVGPDNMGRHLWRLLRPSFFWKMLRTRAGSLYGWDILLRGTLWPGPLIGKHLSHVIRTTAEAGHEIGLHAWDHHHWQAHISSMDASAIDQDLQRGLRTLQRILGRTPSCTASPGWRCTDTVLIRKAGFALDYNSDCRGSEIFLPVVDGQPLAQPQVPVTLPTYDELVGRANMTARGFNDHLLSLIHPERLNVLTIHAEVEGMIHRPLFDQFLERLLNRGGRIVPLKEMLRDLHTLPRAPMVQGILPGREGCVACQGGVVH